MIRKSISILIFLMSLISLRAQEAFISTEGNYFKKIKLKRAGKVKAPIAISKNIKHQKILGFGGSFNELGHVALQLASKKDEKKLMDSLFGKRGLRFNYCRVPLGANDFSLNWYSYSEEMGDFEMKAFDIYRDTLHQIPYIKKALAINPDLGIWASPWSPPMWLKHNKHYGGKAQNMDWGKLYGNNMEEIFANNKFVMEPEYLKAYALYFSKFVSAYKDLGIPLKAVQPQNEVGANQLFPSCVWSAEDLAVFTGDYLVPKLAKDHPDIDVWLGTINIDSTLYVQNFIKKFDNIKGIGVQWDGINMLNDLKAEFPEYYYMQTESECNNGLNEWFTAEHTFDLLYCSFKGGVSYYIYWNMILDDMGLSTWMWRQNSLISVNRFTGEVVYNPEYYVMKHFCHFINTGATMLELENVPSNVKALAFENPNNNLVFLIQNPNKENIQLKIANQRGKCYDLSLEGNSISTVTFY